jgi:aldose 1-epimerase
MPDCIRGRFGALACGTPIDVYTLSNAHGMSVRVLQYGGIVQSLCVPDRHGRSADVVLGFDDVAAYEERSPFFGAIIGRCANRIACGKFTLDGVTHELPVNNGPNHLHGGPRGFHRVVWTIAPFLRSDRAALTLSYQSDDGEQGYPGTLGARVVYTLTEANELAIDYEATTDRATLVNLTHHSYFNLAGHDGGDVLGHDLTIDADAYTPTDGTLIPTGDIAPVAGTPFDFRHATRIGARVDAPDEQIANAGGYDHNWVLRGTGSLSRAARLAESNSGRVMHVYTTEPGLQFYSGNFLDGTLQGKGAHAYGHRSGLCLETQHFPDAPNHSQFPSVVLRPGDVYRSRTVYAFDVA